MTITILIVLKDNHNVYKLNTNNNNNNYHSLFIETLLGSKNYTKPFNSCYSPWGKYYLFYMRKGKHREIK